MSVCACARTCLLLYATKVFYLCMVSFYNLQSKWLVTATKPNSKRCTYSCVFVECSKDKQLQLFQNILVKLVTVCATKGKSMWKYVCTAYHNSMSCCDKIAFLNWRNFFVDLRNWLSLETRRARMMASSPATIQEWDQNYWNSYQWDTIPSKSTSSAMLWLRRRKECWCTRATSRPFTRAPAQLTLTHTDTTPRQTCRYAQCYNFHK